jgi:hypothetical protein
MNANILSETTLALAVGARAVVVSLRTFGIHVVPGESSHAFVSRIISKSFIPSCIESLMIS